MNCMFPWTRGCCLSHISILSWIFRNAWEVMWFFLLWYAGFYCLIFSIKRDISLIIIWCLISGWEASGKSWRNLLEDLEANKDPPNNRAYYHKRLIFFLCSICLIFIFILFLFPFRKLILAKKLEVLCLVHQALCIYLFCVFDLVGFADDLSYRKGSHMEQREKLGLAPAPKGRLATRTPPPEPTNALQKVEVCICSCWFRLQLGCLD